MAEMVCNCREVNDLRARLDLMTREARLSREATDRAVARLAEVEAQERDRSR